MFVYATPLRESLPDHGIVSASTGGGSPKRLLLVEDDPNMIRALECYFERRGFDVVNATTVRSAMAAFERATFWTLVISDFNLADGNGWELSCWINERRRPAPPFLLISGAPNAASYAAKLEFLAKPFSIGQLETRVNGLLASAAAACAGAS